MAAKDRHGEIVNLVTGFIQQVEIAPTVKVVLQNHGEIR
jgi:hypothetical protein